MPIKPGQQLKLRHRERDTLLSGTLTGVGEKELTLALEDAFSLTPGDEMELELDQEQDAPYIFKARVKECGPGNICTLELLGEASPMERRRYPRLPTNFRVRYYIRPEQAGERQCLQGEIRDISSGGALLTTQEPLTLERELMLVLDLPMGRKEAFTTGIGGRVVREEHKGNSEQYSYGVEFSRHLALSGLRG